MLSARAYSFRQNSRLAISLSWIGGYTNVVALMAVGTVVSHVTGTATLLGQSIGSGDVGPALFFGYLLTMFVMGAALSGFTTENARRRGWRSKFILPMALEILLLVVLTILLCQGGKPPSVRVQLEAAGIATLAMGLQNATITRISGAVVRTTHLTGIFTDFGLEGVQYLFWWFDELTRKRRRGARRLFKIARRHPSALRLLLLLSIAGSFGFGTIAGTIAFRHLAPLSLVAPIAFLLWIVYMDWSQPIADVRELDLLNDPELRVSGIISNLLPPGVTLYRASSMHRGTQHRAPDFQLWVDRVADDCRVLVLAISPLIRFDANAMMDLKAAAQRLQRADKALILCEITPGQFKALEALGVARVMDVNNLCSDLEFAVARSLAVLEEMGPPTAGHRHIAAAPA